MTNSKRNLTNTSILETWLSLERIMLLSFEWKTSSRFLRSVNGGRAPPMRWTYWKASSVAVDSCCCGRRFLRRWCWIARTFKYSKQLLSKIRFLFFITVYWWKHLKVFCLFNKTACIHKFSFPLETPTSHPMFKSYCMYVSQLRFENQNDVNLFMRNEISHLFVSHRTFQSLNKF